MIMLTGIQADAFFASMSLIFITLIVLDMEHLNINQKLNWLLGFKVLRLRQRWSNLLSSFTSAFWISGVFGCARFSCFTKDFFAVPVILFTGNFVG